MVFPFFFLMSFLVAFGSVLSVSSFSWFGIWGGLELNLLCFIPMVLHFSSFLSVESVVKYFLVQSFGSIALLLGGLLESSLLSGYLGVFHFVLIFSLLLKAGVFPFHWWVPGVLGGFSWMGVLVFSTWQKVAPVLVFSLVSNFDWLLVMMICFSSLIGGMMGVGQTSVRLILAYSSISHSGWIFVLFCISFYFGLAYFFLYFISTFMLVFFLWYLDYWRVSQSVSFIFLSSVVFLSLVLSVAGVPPFLGFFGKLFGFFALGEGVLSVFVLSILILGSLLSLYFYLGLFFSFFFSGFCSLFDWGFGLILFSFFFVILVVSVFSLLFTDVFLLFFYDMLV